MTCCELVEGELSALATLSALQRLDLYYAQKVRGNLNSLDGLRNIQMIDVTLCFRIKGKRTGEGLVLGPGT